MDKTIKVDSIIKDHLLKNKSFLKDPIYIVFIKFISVTARYFWAVFFMTPVGDGESIYFVSIPLQPKILKGGRKDAQRHL